MDDQSADLATATVADDAPASTADDAAPASSALTDDHHDWVSAFTGIDTKAAASAGSAAASASSDDSSGGGFFSGIANAVSDAASGVVSTAENVASDVGNTVSDAASGVVNTVETVAGDVGHTVADAAGGLVDTAGKVASDVGSGNFGDALGDAASGVVATTGHLVSDVAHTAVDAGSGMLATAGKIVTDTEQTVTDAATGAISTAGKVVGDTAQAVAQAAGPNSLLGQAAGAVGDFSTSAASGLVDTVNTVNDFNKGVVEGVVGGVEGLAKGVVSLGDSVGKEAFALATDEKAREQAAQTVLHGAEAVGNFEATVLTDPSKALGEVEDAAGGAVNTVENMASNVYQGYQAAAAQGHGAEFIGKGVGQAGVLVAGAVLTDGASLGAEAGAAGAEGAALLAEGAEGAAALSEGAAVAGEAGALAVEGAAASGEAGAAAAEAGAAAGEGAAAAGEEGAAAAGRAAGVPGEPPIPETPGPAEFPPDWQHGAPTKPVSPDPHVYEIPGEPTAPPQGPYRTAGSLADDGVAGAGDPATAGQKGASAIGDPGPGIDDITATPGADPGPLPARFQGPNQPIKLFDTELQPIEPGSPNLTAYPKSGEPIPYELGDGPPPGQVQVRPGDGSPVDDPLAQTQEMPAVAATPPSPGMEVAEEGATAGEAAEAAGEGVGAGGEGPAGGGGGEPPGGGDPPSSGGGGGDEPPPSSASAGRSGSGGPGGEEPPSGDEPPDSQDLIADDAPQDDEVGGTEQITDLDKQQLDTLLKDMGVEDEGMRREIGKRLAQDHRQGIIPHEHFKDAESLRPYVDEIRETENIKVRPRRGGGRQPPTDLRDPWDDE